MVNCLFNKNFERAGWIEEILASIESHVKLIMYNNTRFIRQPFCQLNKYITGESE